VGSVVAAILAAHYDSMDDLLQATEEELKGIHGIGPISARSLVEWFSHEPNRALIEKLRVAGVDFASHRAPAQAAGDAPLAGLTFVITGTLPTMSRDEAKALIEQHGGKVILTTKADEGTSDTSFIPDVPPSQDSDMPETAAPDNGLGERADAPEAAAGQ
jgi:NAD-dependent DNA ligase